MFDIGWSEMAVIMLVALIVIGPKDLPRLARNLGQWVAKGRAMAREFQRSLEDMAREAELDDVRREIEKVGRTDIKKSLEKAIDPSGDLGKAFDPSSSRTPAKAGAAAANGGAKPPAAARPAAAPAAPPQQAPPEPSASVAPAEPKATPKPRASAKPKASAEPKTAAKPRTRAKPKTTTETASKPAASPTGNGAGPS
jgi:sec-independent protein translocase protein TatB